MDPRGARRTRSFLPLLLLMVVLGALVVPSNLGSAASVPRALPGGGPIAAPGSTLPPSGGVPPLVRAHGTALPAGPANLTLTGYTHQTISTTTTVGNITISGNASLAVTGKTTLLTVEGNILLESNGTLYQNLSSLEIDQTFINEYAVTMLQDARWTVQHGTVTSNGWQAMGYFYGDSNLSVNNSMFFAGQNWIAANLGYSGNWTIANTTIGSDVNLLITPQTPDESTVRIVNCSGFNIWPNFMAGMTANLTLPKTDPANHGLTWTNWTFPAGAQVTGVHYRIILVKDRLWRIGPHLWNGADVTVDNTDNVQLGFFIEKSTDFFSGFLIEHYWTLAYVSSQFDLHLRNDTVFSWGWFPYSADLTVNDSDIGQVMASDQSVVHLLDDNYTGITGELGVSQSATLSVANTSIAAIVSGAGTGSIVLTNCSVTQGPLNSGPISVQANQFSTVTLVNTTVQAGQKLQAQQGGTIVVDQLLSLRESDASGPAAGAIDTVLWTSNSTQAASGVASSAGIANFTLHDLTITVSGTVTTDGYAVQALAGDDLGGAAVTLTGRTSMALWLHAMVVGTWPADLATNVPTSAAVSVDFGQPMAAATTASAVSVAPGVIGSSAWNGNDTNLTLSVTLSAGTLYTILVGTGAATEGGVTLPLAFLATFTTAAAPVVLTSVAVSPPSGSVDVGASLTLTAAPSCGSSACPTGTSYAWSVTNGNGVLNTTQGTVVGLEGLQAGVETVLVNATLDGVTVEGSPVAVTVQATTTSVPPLVSVALSPPSAMVGQGKVQVFTAAPTCSGGACPSGTIFLWAVTSSDASLNATSGASVTLTGGSTTGSVGLFVNATLNGVTEEASATVEIQASATSSAPPTSSSGGLFGVSGLTLTLLLGLAIVAIAAGILLGVWRSRRRPSAAPASSEPSAPPAPSPPDGPSNEPPPPG